MRLRITHQLSLLLAVRGGGGVAAQRAVLDELHGRPPRLQPAGTPGPDGPRRGAPDEEDGDPPGHRPPPGMGWPPPPRPEFDRPGARPPRGMGGELGDRIVVRDTQGGWLAGRPQPPNVARTVRAVQVNGADVAFVELGAAPGPEGIDARFLQRQSSSLLLTALATIVLTVLAAW